MVVDQREDEKDDDSEGYEHEECYASGAENSGSWAYEGGCKILTRRGSHNTQVVGWPRAEHEGCAQSPRRTGSRSNAVRN